MLFKSLEEFLYLWSHSISPLYLQEGNPMEASHEFTVFSMGEKSLFPGVFRFLFETKDPFEMRWSRSIFPTPEASAAPGGWWQSEGRSDLHILFLPREDALFSIKNKIIVNVSTPHPSGLLKASCLVSESDVITHWRATCLQARLGGRDLRIFPSEAAHHPPPMIRSQVIIHFESQRMEKKWTATEPFHHGFSDPLETNG